MKSTAAQVVKRVELALEQAIMDHGALPWQIEFAELTLWIHAGQGGGLQARVLVQGETIPKRGLAQTPVTDRSVTYEQMVASKNAPFYGSATAREWQRSRQLSRFVEVALESVNTLKSEGGSSTAPWMELKFWLIVHVDGEVTVVTTAQQALGDKWHALKLRFTETKDCKGNGSRIVDE